MGEEVKKGLDGLRARLIAMHIQCREVMFYKGYQSKVELDEEAGVFHGEVINTRDVITFQGTSVEELKQAFEDSVDDYLEFCAVRSEPRA